MNYCNFRIVYEKNHSGRQRQARRKRPNAANTEMMQNRKHTNTYIENKGKNVADTKEDTKEMQQGNAANSKKQNGGAPDR